MLDQHHAEERGEKIPNGELMFSILGLPGRAFVGSWAFLVATVIESEKSQNAPNGVDSVLVDCLSSMRPSRASATG
jgi:hypothetical protein